MREIQIETVIEKVKEICLTAAYQLPKDVRDAFDNSIANEKSPLGKNILKSCVENADISAKGKLPLCQDTGFAVYFVELGNNVHIVGGTIEDAINEGTRQGYTDGFLRKSILVDPLLNRKNSGDNTPAVIHISFVEGKEVKIVLAPKGGGSENMSRIAMLKPSDGVDGVVDFVVDSVISAGGNPCPPTIVGVGIGGTFEKVAYLSKKALLREVGNRNPDKGYADLELKILEKINRSGIGAQGLGGSMTAFDVHIETYPCHIASMPVAVNLNCHAARHAEIII